jgi:IclR family KDG regulon transcriptional repressor
LKDNLEDKNIIKSAIKVFSLLEILIHNGRLSLSELSNLTGYTKSTTQRIVNTLSLLKYIHQDEVTLEYYPSIKLYELGNYVVNNISIKNIAKPFLLKLYNALNETINLGILDNNNVIYLDKLVSKSPLKAELELGVEVPIYCSALGKVIAAFDNEKISFTNNYIKYTENTIISDEELNNNLLEIKKQGYAIDNEEYVKGLICIAVPILGSTGDAIAAISVSIPKIRFENSKTDYYVSILKDYAIKIQNNL